METTACANATKEFINKLVEIYKKKREESKSKSIESIEPDEIYKHILDWIKKGTDSRYVDTLLSAPEGRDTFPIWWSGFWIENPDTVENPDTKKKKI